MLRIFGGNGYNVNSYDQVDFVEIVIRSGNGNPKGVSIAAYRRNAKNIHQVFAVNTSGDNYDIYVNYGRYTDNVIVEYGKTNDVTLTVHDVPEITLVKPSTGVTDGKVITMFNTENKAGTIRFDDNTQGTYDIISLCNDTGDGKKYLRQFRSKSGHTIWHETVQGSVYRLATGSTDSNEVLKITDRTLQTGRAVLDGGNIRLERQTGNSNLVEYWDRRNGANARQSWIGFGNADTNAFQIYSDAGKNNFALEQSGQISLNVGATKIVHTNGQYISTNADAYRMIYGNYGAFWRNDGVKTYLLSTAENDKWGSWTGNRPFIYEFSSGNVNLGGDSNKSALTLEGASKAARFGGHVYTGGNLNVSGQHITMEAGLAGQSRDFIRFNHWGDSSNGRDNVLYVEDSKGRHFSTERNMATGGLKANFLGDFEVGGKLTWGKGTAQSSFNCRVWGNADRKQVFECADESGWHWYSQRAGGPGTTAIQFSVNGQINAQNLNVSGKVTTPQISAFGVNVANVLGGNSIVLGDSDTGFKQNGDGILDVYANNVAVMRFTSGAITANKAVNVTGRVTPTDYGNFDGRYIKKTKGCTKIWSGTLPGNTQTGGLPQDLRFRNVWILDAAGFNHFIRFANDGNYYLAGNGGWIKIQLHSSGKIFKNIQDSNFVPREIWVENE